MIEFEQCTLDDVEEALSFLDPSVDRDTWVVIGMAIKSEFGEMGRSEFENWSMGSDKYSKSNFKSTWRSLKQGGGTTIKTLFKMAMDAGYKPAQPELSEEEKQKRHHEAQLRRVEREREAVEEQARLDSLQVQISQICQQAWASDYLGCTGESEYLKRKQVGPAGAKFVVNSFMVVVDLVNTNAYTLIDHKDMVATAAKKKQTPDDISFTWFKKGDLVIPMFDMQGILWSLQVIKPSGTKMFIKNSRKSGTCFLIGKILPNDGVVPICLAEGFATGASINMATGYPVFVCWDAGNLLKISAQVREAYPKYPLLVCGDNDAFHKETGAVKPQKDNDGLNSAMKASKAARCGFVVPDFSQLMADIKEAVND